MKTVAKCEAVMFDLDGVLIDTESQYSKFWEKVGSEYYPNDLEFASKLKGMTLKNILCKFFGDDMEKCRSVVAGLNAFEAGMNYDYVPGAENFIGSLKAAGVKTAVVTSSDNNKMNNLYSAHPNFMELFDKICTAEDSKRSKPAPDCYLNCSESLGVLPCNCAIFEDSFNGLEAAKASGAKVVGLSTTNSLKEIKGYCDCVISDFKSFSLDKLNALFNK